MKILLAVDGSKYTKKMLAYLTVHAELFAAVNDFTVFTAQAPLPPRARAAVGKDIADAYHAEESEKIVAPVCKFLARHGINAKSAWKVGHAGEAMAMASVQPWRRKASVSPATSSDQMPTWCRPGRRPASSTGKLGSTRGPASTRTTRVARGSMRRKSRPRV